MEVHCLLEQLNLLQTQREAVEASIEALMAQIPQHLTTITGIGPVTRAAILAEIGEVTRFPSLEAWVAYAGIDATVHQSGEFVAPQKHRSKRGSPYLRRALWQAATALLSTEGNWPPTIKRSVRKAKRMAPPWERCVGNCWRGFMWCSRRTELMSRGSGQKDRVEKRAPFQLGRAASRSSFALFRTNDTENGIVRTISKEP
jgi:transposase